MSLKGRAYTNKPTVLDAALFTHNIPLQPLNKTLAPSGGVYVFSGTALFSTTRLTGLYCAKKHGLCVGKDDHYCYLQETAYNNGH